MTLAAALLTILTSPLKADSSSTRRVAKVPSSRWRAPLLGLRPAGRLTFAAERRDNLQVARDVPLKCRVHLEAVLSFALSVTSPECDCSE